MNRLSVIIPVFNEEQTVGELLARVNHAPLPPAIQSLEIVLVDDRSTDGTWGVLELWSPEIRDDGVPIEVISQRHDRNRLRRNNVGGEHLLQFLETSQEVPEESRSGQAQQQSSQDLLDRNRGVPPELPISGHVHPALQNAAGRRQDELGVLGSHDQGFPESKEHHQPQWHEQELTARLQEMTPAYALTIVLLTVPCNAAHLL